MENEYSNSDVETASGTQRIFSYEGVSRHDLIPEMYSRLQDEEHFTETTMTYTRHSSTDKNHERRGIGLGFGTFSKVNGMGTPSKIYSDSNVEVNHKEKRKVGRPKGSVMKKNNQETNFDGRLSDYNKKNFTGIDLFSGKSKMDQSLNLQDKHLIKRKVGRPKGSVAKKPNSNLPETNQVKRKRGRPKGSLSMKTIQTFKIKTSSSDTTNENHLFFGELSKTTIKMEATSNLQENCVLKRKAGRPKGSLGIKKIQALKIKNCSSDATNENHLFPRELSRTIVKRESTSNSQENCVVKRKVGRPKGSLSKKKHVEKCSMPLISREVKMEPLLTPSKSVEVKDKLGPPETCEKAESKKVITHKTVIEDEQNLEIIIQDIHSIAKRTEQNITTLSEPNIQTYFHEKVENWQLLTGGNQQTLKVSNLLNSNHDEPLRNLIVENKSDKNPSVTMKENVSNEGDSPQSLNFSNDEGNQNIPIIIENRSQSTKYHDQSATNSLETNIED